MRASREPDSILLNVKSALAGLDAIREQMLEMLDAFGPAVVKGVMRKMIADTLEGRLRPADADPGRHLERAPVRHRPHAGRGHDAPGGADAHQARRPGHLHERRYLAAGRRGQLDVRLPARAVVGARWRRRSPGTSSAAPPGVANHVVFDPEPGTRNVARWPAAVSAHQSTFITLDLAAAGDEQDAPQRARRTLRERAYTRRRAGAAARRHRARASTSTCALVATPGSAGQGAARRLPRRVPASATASTAAARGGWSGRRRATSRRARRTGIASCSSAPRTPTAADPASGAAATASPSAGRRTRPSCGAADDRSPTRATNAVAGLAGGYHGLGGNFLHLGSDRLGELVAAGEAARAAAPRSRSSGGPLEPAALRRLSPAAAAGDCVVVEFNGSAGYGDPLGRDPERVARDVDDGKVEPTSRPSATTAWPRRRRRRRAGTESAAGGDPRGAARTARPRSATARGTRRRRSSCAARQAASTSPSDAGERVWACSACGEQPRPDHRELQASARGYRSARRRPSTTGSTPTRRSSPTTSSLLRQYAARAAPRCSRRSSAWPSDEPWHDFQLEPRRTATMA